MALADPVRRALVARLSRGPATVNELAGPIPAGRRTQLPPARHSAGRARGHRRARGHGRVCGAHHHRGGEPMTNALDLTAPVDTLAMEFTREFDASVAALFQAHADADLFRRWIGPRAGVMT